MNQQDAGKPAPEAMGAADVRGEQPPLPFEDELDDDDDDLPSGTMFSRRDGVEYDVVYCLSNEVYQGLYKIGYTGRTAQHRARELFSGYQAESATGVPAPFDVVKEWEVPKGLGYEIEQALHLALNTRRFRPDKEFFRFGSAQEAVEQIEQLLRRTDAFAVAEAEMERRRHEVALRAEQRRAFEAQQERERRHQQIAERIKQEARARAVELTADQCQMTGLAWGAGLGCALALLAVATDAKGGFYIFAGLAAVVAYHWNFNTPLNEWLGSDEYKLTVDTAIAEAIAADTAGPERQTATPSARRERPETPAPKPRAHRQEPEAPPPTPGADNGNRVSGAETANLDKEAAKRPPPEPSRDAIRKALVRCPQCRQQYSVSGAVGSKVRCYCMACEKGFEATALKPMSTQDALVIPSRVISRPR